MRVALACSHVGIPGTLASTAFTRGLADGFGRLGIAACVVGLATSEDEWLTEALGGCETVTPWLSPPPPQLRDELAAVLLGIVDGGELDGDDWYRELLLQRALEDVAGPDRDLTIVLEPRSDSYLRVVCRIARRKGWRVVVSAFEALSDRLIDPATRDAYVARAVECSDGVWALTRHLADYWRGQGVPQERIMLWPTVLAHDAFVTGNPPHASTGVYLAKNIADAAYSEVDRLLDVVASVHQRVPSFTLAVYGDVDERVRAGIRDAVDARSLAGVVSVSAGINPLDLSHVIANADVLLLPLADDRFTTAGFPKKLGEYLATGRPVVVTSIGDIPHYLVDGEHAVLVQPGDSDAFADAVVRVLTDTANAERIGARGQQLATELFDSPVVARHLIEFVGGLPAPERARVDGVRRLSRWGRAMRLVAAPAAVELHQVTDRLLVNADGERRTAAAWRTTIQRVKYTRSGHTRIVALKMAIVRALRALRLKPPAPRE